jgi:hypothetical protein
MDAEGRDGPIDQEGLIDAQVFEQVEVDVSIENMTSGTGLQGDRRTYGKESVSEDANPLTIKLMEFREGGIALDVPSRTGAQGHIVRIDFVVRGAKLPIHFHASGIVESVVPLDAGREKFEVRLTEFDPEYLGALKAIFSQRQEEIERFLEQVRG